VKYAQDQRQTELIIGNLKTVRILKFSIMGHHQAFVTKAESSHVLREQSATCHKNNTKNKDQL